MAGTWGEPPEKGETGDTGSAGSTGPNGSGWEIARNDTIGSAAHIIGGFPWGVWTTVWTFFHAPGQTVSIAGFAKLVAMDGVGQLGTSTAQLSGSTIRHGIPAPVPDGALALTLSGSIRNADWELGSDGTNTTLRFFHQIAPVPAQNAIVDGRIFLTLTVSNAGPT